MIEFLLWPLKAVVAGLIAHPRCWRRCCICTRSISACFGYTLCGDWLDNAKHVREMCGYCVQVFKVVKRWD